MGGCYICGKQSLSKFDHLGNATTDLRHSPKGIGKVTARRMINRRGVIFIVSLAIATAVTLIGTYYAVNWDSAADQPNHAAQPIAALAKQNSGPYFPEGGQY